MSANPPDKRRRILDAAVSVFAQHGFYNAKVSQIAKEAGVADGTIYLYFKNKEDILIQVFIDAMDEILRRQEEAIGQVSDPIDRPGVGVLIAGTRSTALALSVMACTGHWAQYPGAVTSF